jgi:hypothetical protein
MGVLPFVLAAAFAFGLELSGLLPEAPPAPAPADSVPLDGGAAAGLAAVLLVLVAGWAGVRSLMLRALRVRGNPRSPGGAAALALVMSVLTAAVWVRNPYAAALLLLPLHAWLWVTVPEVRLRRAVALAVVAVSVLPIAAIVVYYATRLGLGPIDVAWTALLLVVGGHIGPLGVLAWCVLLGCLGSVLAMTRRQGLEDSDSTEAPTIRGPLTYAGPGSLGGTESALRR